MTIRDYDVEIPNDAEQMEQNEEWIKVVTKNEEKKLLIHDYANVYKIPGLYEEVVYDRLRCCSPEVVCDTLEKIMDDVDSPLNVLDFGAGNGIVAEHLRERFSCDAVIGLDILPEAREAAERDRPDVYDDYLVMDVSNMDASKLQKFEAWNFNSLVTVAALGFGDIPAKAFVNAFNLIEEGGWVAFNIKDRFMSSDDDTGYHDTIEAMMGGSLDVMQQTRYCHRLSVTGEPLHYYAIAGRKIADVPS
jgi:predicted TPR repeat methyltransferase